jgi:hypothetical protein
MVEFEGGAKRSDSKPMYRKMPFGPLRRKALTYSEGSMKYDEDIYDANWKKGDVEFAAACFDHAIEHLYKWIEGDTSEDHLAHASVNLDFLMYFEDERIFIPGDLPQPAVVLPEPEPEPEEDRMAKALRILGIKK